MDPSISTVLTLSLDDKPWIASAKGTTTCRTITLDLTKGFTLNTHYTDGYILSGLPLGKVTATGLYGVYDDAASDGRQTCVGFLFGREKYPAGGSAVKVGGALFWEGVVKTSRLPVSLDANGQTDLAAKFRFE